MFYVHPEPWGRWTHFYEYFSDGLKVETTNQSLCSKPSTKQTPVPKFQPPKVLVSSPLVDTASYLYMYNICMYIIIHIYMCVDIFIYICSIFPIQFCEYYNKPLWFMDPSPSQFWLFQPPGPALDSEWIGELNAGCEAGGFFLSAKFWWVFLVRKFCHGHTSWFNHQLYSHIFLEDTVTKKFPAIHGFAGGLS